MPVASQPTGLVRQHNLNRCSGWEHRMAYPSRVYSMPSQCNICFRVLFVTSQLEKENSVAAAGNLQRLTYYSGVIAAGLTSTASGCQALIRSLARCLP